MPRPTNERQSLARELREELPDQLAGYQQELVAGLADKTRREWLEWHIRRVQKRMFGVGGSLTMLRRLANRLRDPSTAGAG